MANRAPIDGSSAIVIVAAILVSSCVTSPAVRAKETERLQCDANCVVDERTIYRLSVLSVAPLYVKIHSSTMGEENRTLGAKLLVRPPPGLDVDRFLRALQCHAARIALGLEAPSDMHDPFRLPGGFVDVDVETVQGNFAISIAADRISDGLFILAEAQAFARSHPSERRALMPG